MSIQKLTYRSRVPDLIYEDQFSSRIHSIAPYLDKPHLISPAIALHRLTMFVTYRCNLSCSYCKMMDLTQAKLCGEEEKPLLFDTDKFRWLLNVYNDPPPEHLHLTGGEASLVKELPSMIRFAKEMGIKNVSTTSNGTLPSSVYLELIEAGLDEIRISLDSTVELSTKLSEKEQKNVLRATGTILDLVEAKRSKTDPFIIVNTVVTPENYSSLPQLIRSFLEMGVNDMKLIPEIESVGTLRALEKEQRVRKEIEAILDALPKYAYPLLRLKVEKLFDAEPIGLRSVQYKRKRDWYCYIPLTERTVDGLYYYPCSVYLREGGAPIGRIDEPMEVQCQKSADFVAKGDCLDDPICQNYCLYCIREYNKSANEVKGVC